MQRSGSVSAVLGGLVHPLARHPALLRLQHRDFIAAKLGFSAVALAGAPVFVAVRGVPTPVEAGIFALAMMQLAAAMLVARRGQLEAGQLIAALGLAAIGAACLPSLGAGSAAAWFLAAAVDALAAEGTRFRRLAALAAAAALGAGAVAVGQPVALAGGIAPIAAIAAALPLLQAAWRLGRQRDAATAAARSLQEREHRFSVMAGAALFTVDRGGRVVEITACGGALNGLDGDALRGRGLFEHVQVADRPAFLKLVSDAAHEAGVQTTSLRLKVDLAAQEQAIGSEAAGTGRPSFVRLDMRAMRAVPDGSAVSLVALPDATDEIPTRTGRDETERPSERLAAEMVRSRDDVLTTISHELRTPLNAVIGFSEVLAGANLRPIEPARQQEYAGIILQAGQHLLSIVNAMLDLSTIRSGTFALLPERFDPAELVGDCLDMMQLKATAGGVALHGDVADGLAPINGDRRACKQILLNLLSNAIKFTPDGGAVRVAARCDGTALVLRVADTGIGIAAADVAKLGQPFFQAHRASGRRGDGTGLGLAVVRGLVDLHGGVLHIASEPGRGTTVDVRLPLPEPAGATVRCDGGAPVPDREPSAAAAGKVAALLPVRRHYRDERMKRSA